MTFNIVIVLALLMVVLGIVTMLVRRSFAGLVSGAQLGLGGLVLLASVLFDLTGSEQSTGQVIAVVIIVFAVVVAMVGIALHLAAARALREPGNPEPW